MDGVGFDFTQKDVLNIHYVQILPVYELLERVYTQGILHDLRTNFTVHVSGQVIAQRGKGNNQEAIRKSTVSTESNTEIPFSLDTRKVTISSRVFSFVMVSLYLNLILLQKAFLLFSSYLLPLINFLFII